MFYSRGNIFKLIFKTGKIVFPHCFKRNCSLKAKQTNKNNPKVVIVFSLVKTSILHQLSTWIYLDNPLTPSTNKED